MDEFDLCLDSKLGSDLLDEDARWLVIWAAVEVEDLDARPSHRFAAALTVKGIVEPIEVARIDWR